MSKRDNKKINSIYNQAVIYGFAALALSVPFLTPYKASNNAPNKPSAHKQKAMALGAISPEQNNTILADPLPIALLAQILTTSLAADIKADPVSVENLQPIQPIADEHVEAPVSPVETSPVVAPIIAKASQPVIKVKMPKTISIDDTKIDHKFLAKVEGTVLKGYVPLPKTTKSGVTIGSGFDLGQMKIAEFNSLPISAALKAKLKPYVGLKKFSAVAFLKNNPLTINDEELKEVNAIAANKILIPLVKAYDKSSPVPFAHLPAEAQTALFSFAYQYGPGFMKKAGTKKLWDYYVVQDWEKVKATLRSYKMYSGRRKQEAALLNNLHKKSSQ